MTVADRLAHPERLVRLEFQVSLEPMDDREKMATAQKIPMARMARTARMAPMVLTVGMGNLGNTVGTPYVKRMMEFFSTTLPVTSVGFLKSAPMVATGDQVGLVGLVVRVAEAVTEDKVDAGWPATASSGMVGMVETVGEAGAAVTVVTAAMGVMAVMAAMPSQSMLLTHQIGWSKSPSKPMGGEVEEAGLAVNLDRPASLGSQATAGWAAIPLRAPMVTGAAAQGARHHQVMVIPVSTDRMVTTDKARMWNVPPTYATKNSLGVAAAVARTTIGPFTCPMTAG